MQRPIYTTSEGAYVTQVDPDAVTPVVPVYFMQKIGPQWSIYTQGELSRDALIPTGEVWSVDWHGSDG